MRLYRLLVGPAAVIARGEVAHVGHGKPPAGFGVGAVLLEVTETLEKFLDGALVVADEVGVAGDVMSVPGGGRQAKREVLQAATVPHQKPALGGSVIHGKCGHQLGFRGPVQPEKPVEPRTGRGEGTHCS